MSDAGSGRGRRVPWPATVSVGGELIERLNTWWRIAGPEPAHASFKQRLAYPLRRLLARVLGPQETFNSAVVQYINATTTAQQQMLDAVLDAALDRTDAAMDDVRRYREALAARERRMEAAMSAMLAQHEEARSSLGVLQQVTREIDRRQKMLDRGREAEGSGQKEEGRRKEEDYESGHALSHKYVGFEDQFRGSQEQIREGLREYVPLFAGAADVLDVGCGRGEFLKLLREAGVSARGIDVNDAMVDVSRQQRLDATVADALSYLRAQPDGSLGGLFAAQVVEHLEPAYLTHFVDVAFDKLRPGSTIVLETINPACWFAFFESYIRDITHVRPLHPDTLKFLLVASGFQQIEIRYRAPYPEHEKLQPVPASVGSADIAATLNANVEKINRLLFTHLDYAAIGKRP